MGWRLLSESADAHTLSLIVSLREIFYVRPQWEEVRKPQHTQCFNCLELKGWRVHYAERMQGMLGDW